MVVIAIAFNTFRESVRDKILYVILLFALGFALVSGIVSQWSLNQEEKILLDFGLLIITVFGVFIAVFSGISMIYKELDKRTIYTILSKPISRGQFLWGKYFGLNLTLLVSFLFMAVGFVFVLWIFTGKFNLLLLPAVGMIFFQMTIVTAVTIFLAIFASAMVSAVLALFIFLSGNFSADITVLGAGFESPYFAAFLNTLYYILPNFTRLNINNFVVHGIPLQFGDIALAIVYSLAYSSAMIIAATVIFNRKNLL